MFIRTTKYDIEKLLDDRLHRNVFIFYVEDKFFQLTCATPKKQLKIFLLDAYD